MKFHSGLASGGSRFFLCLNLQSESEIVKNIEWRPNEGDSAADV